MTKKTLVIVGLAAIVAASTGVAFASGNVNKLFSGTDGFAVNPTAATETVVDNDASDNGNIASGDSSDIGSDVSGSVAPSASNDDDIEIVLDDHHDDEEITADLSESYTVKRVLDRESGEELSPQVALGKAYSECYLNTYTDGSIKLCLNPASGESRTGVYSIYNDMIYADFGDDRTEKYFIIYSDDNTVESIIVTYGAFDVYFG